MDTERRFAIGAGFARWAWLKYYQALAAPLLGAVKITAVKVLQLDFQADGCLVKIETDAGVVGYGETGVDAKMARARIPQLRLVGGDALAIERHFLSMTGAIHPFVPSIPLISGIDIALWDVAGKVLGLPIYRLMGGPQRNAVPMYSHGDFLKDMTSPASCREWAQMIRAPSPRALRRTRSSRPRPSPARPWVRW